MMKRKRQLTLLLLFLGSFFSEPLFAQKCAFCSSQVIERQVVAENDHYHILVDIAPVVDGHLLLIPKRHVEKAHEMTCEEWSAMHEMVGRIVFFFGQEFQTDQYVVLEKNGPYAGQTVPHVHFHFLPMPKYQIADKMKETLYAKIFNQLPQKLTPDELQALVSRYRAAFKE